MMQLDYGEQQKLLDPLEGTGPEPILPLNMFPCT